MQARWFAFFVGFAVTLPMVGCARNDPPGASSPPNPRVVQADATRPIALATSPTGSGVSPTGSGVSPTGTATRNATGVPIASAAPQQNNPPLFDSAGEPLPQTDTRPVASSPAFRDRMGRLCQAIVSGVTADAHDAFFPLAAYKQVKAVADPERDYRLRLLSHFDRDILDYHRKLSRRPSPYRCGEFTVPENQARWMKPGSEYNKLGYFRVLRSHLQVIDAAERALTFEVTSLISWRGEWYVVHLNGFE